MEYCHLLIVQVTLASVGCRFFALTLNNYPIDSFSALIQPRFYVPLYNLAYTVINLTLIIWIRLSGVGLFYRPILSRSSKVYR